MSPQPVRLWIVRLYSAEFSDRLDTQGWYCAGDSEDIASVRLPASEHLKVWEFDRRSQIWECVPRTLYSTTALWAHLCPVSAVWSTLRISASPSLARLSTLVTTR